MGTGPGKVLDDVRFFLYRYPVLKLTERSFLLSSRARPAHHYYNLRVGVEQVTKAYRSVYFRKGLSLRSCEQ